MVGGALTKRFFHNLGKGLAGSNEQAPQILAQGHALAEELLSGQFVHLAYKLPGLKVDLLVALLELVELFEHGDGQHHVVVLKIVQALVVVQEHVGVENERSEERRVGKEW